MKHRIDVRGVIIPNDYKWIYDFFEMDSTCPNDVSKILNQAKAGDDVDIYINSPGGVIDCGSEIYTAIRQRTADLNIEMYITGEACSAASVIACAAHCAMSPTALMMVHCVSVGDYSGNHNDFEHMAETLSTADHAICTAYTSKTGMTTEEALEMMEHETWLTAEQAKERGLVDEIMFEESDPVAMVAAVGFKLPTQEQMEKVRALMESREDHESAANINDLRRSEAKKLFISKRINTGGIKS